MQTVPCLVICMFVNSLNSRFGTIAVPNIMVFHNAKAVARFNGTERTLTTISAFVTNVTGIAHYHILFLSYLNINAKCMIALHSL